MALVLRCHLTVTSSDRRELFCHTQPPKARPWVACRADGVSSLETHPMLPTQGVGSTDPREPRRCEGTNRSFPSLDPQALLTERSPLHLEPDTEDKRIRILFLLNRLLRGPAPAHARLVKVATSARISRPRTGHSSPHERLLLACPTA